MAAIIIRDRMPPLLDARGLACPLPAVKARAALAALAPGETLVVLATDPEAPVDIGALAAARGPRGPRSTRGRRGPTWPVCRARTARAGGVGTRCTKRGPSRTPPLDLPAT